MTRTGRTTSPITSFWCKNKPANKTGVKSSQKLGVGRMRHVDKKTKQNDSKPKPKTGMAIKWREYFNDEDKDDSGTEPFPVFTV